MENRDPTLEPEPDPLAAEQADAAAQEAGAIGGRADDDVDPAERPLAEAGQGYAEGFEQAEEELIDHAQHGDAGGDPLADEIVVDADAARSTAEYGDPDAINPHENVEDTEQG